MNQTISLYLQLERGQHPDIDVVAAVSSAFAQLIRETAFIVDPSTQVRIEFESGTEGSLSLNAIVRFVKEKIPDPLVRGTILGVVLSYLTREVVSAIIALVTEAAVVDQSISDADVSRIASEVARLVEGGTARSEAQEVYRVIEKEPSITGVGVTFEKGSRPRTIISRDEFKVRAGFEEPLMGHVETRTKTDQDVIVLVSPVLELNQRNRKWRFLRRGEPFNATVEDPVFLRDVLTGRHKLPMVAGIEMDALLEIEETRKGAVWVVTGRKVLDVRQSRHPVEQDDLFGSH